MKEAEITCLCTFLRLQDLGLELSKGEVAHIPAVQARESEDLKRARRVRGVFVREVERYQEKPAKPLPNLKVSPSKPPARVFPRSTRGGGGSMPPVSVTVPAPVVQIDTDEIVERVVLALSPVLQSSRAVSPQPVAEVASAPPEPVFVPKGIVKDSKARVMVKSQESDSSGIDEAAKALKGRSKTRKSKRKKD